MDMLRKHPDSLNQAEHEEKNLMYNHILERLFVNNIRKAAIAFNDNKKPIKPSYPLGTLVNFSLDMKIAKPRHIIEVMLFYGEMASKFYELERKIAAEMEDQKISDDNKINLRYHIVGGEIETFEFE